MKRGSTRDSHLIDEVALLEKASRLFESNLSHDNLREITTSHGINHSTAVLYKYLSNRHQEFISKINSYPTSLATSRRPTKIIVIPGMFYKEHGDIGADGSLVRNITKKFGFEVELIETLSRGSVADNKEIIVKKLLENKHENVWLVSISKGSTEVRSVLEELKGKDVTKNIKGWISIVGLTKGTPHADKKLRNSFTKTTCYLTFKILGVDYAVTEEMACKNNSLKKEMLLDSHLEVIHINGFPLVSHVEPLLVKRYKALAEGGPNDGILLLQDLLYVPGNVYPVWGVDHFLRTSEMSEIIYKMCHYINNTK